MMDQQDPLVNLTLSLEARNRSTMVPQWFFEDYGNQLPIYAITVYHLYPILVIGRVMHIGWYIIGFLGNSISFKLWTLPRMRKLNSSAPYLVSISFCDILYQVCHVFFYLKYFWGTASLGIPGFCQAWNILNLIPQYANQLLVLGFTTERLISIVRPFQGERFSKHSRAPKEIAIIFVFVILLAAPQGMFWTVDATGFCDIELDQLEVYGVWSVVTESLIFLVVPAITLILNLILLKKASESLQKHNPLNSDASSSSRVHHKGKATKPATKTLMCISFFRIFTQLPVSVTYTVHNFDIFTFGNLMPLADMTNDPQKIAFLRYWGTRMLFEIFGASHHALSVFIFYASTKQFRNELRNLLINAKDILRHGKTGVTLKRSLSSDMRLTGYLTVHRTSSCNIHATNKS